VSGESHLITHSSADDGILDSDFGTLAMLLLLLEILVFVSNGVNVCFGLCFKRRRARAKDEHNPTKPAATAVNATVVVVPVSNRWNDDIFDDDGE
jgi:hypothetical protein